MAVQWRERLPRALGWSGQAAAAIASLYAFRVYATFAGSRLFESYPLVWVEPIFFRGALAAFAGEPTFPEPSLDYTAAIYNPGVAWLAGTLFHWTTPSFPVIRLIAFAAFLALIVVVAVWSYLESRDWGWALAVALLGLATSASCQYITTTVNADLPCLLFGVAAVLLVARDGKSRVAVLAAAGCVVVSFVFKQQGAVFGLGIALALVAQSRRRALWFVATAGGIALALEAALYLSSDGWSWVYTFRIPFETASRPNAHFWRLWFDHYPLAAVALGACLPVLVVLESPGRRWLWPVLAVAALAMSHAGFTKEGGAANSLLPAYWIGIVMLSATYTVLSRRIPRGFARSGVLLMLLAVAIVSAFDQLGWVRARVQRLEAVAARADSETSDARSRRPTFPRNARFERRLREAVMATEGRVFVGARFAAWMDLARPLNTHQIPIMEGTDRAPLFDAGAFDRQLAEHPFAAMYVWDHPFDPTFDRILEAHYEKGERLGVDPLVGHKVYVWRPIESAPDAARAP